MKLHIRKENLEIKISKNNKFTQKPHDVKKNYINNPHLQ